MKRGKKGDPKTGRSASSGFDGGLRDRALVFGGALLVKALVLAALHDHPLLQPDPTLDSGFYAGLASRVASGDLALGPGPFVVSPLYAYVLGVLFALSGGSLLFAKVVQIVLGAAAVVLVFETARATLPRRAAFLAAGFVALAGVVAFHEALILQTALDPALTAFLCWALVRARSEGPRAWLLAGLALGLLALNRPNAILLAPLLATYALFPGLALRRALAFAGGVALALAPATLRNLAVSGEPILISSHGGLNLFIGNNPGADGTYRSVPGITPSIAGQARDTRRVAEAEAGRTLSEREVSAHFTAKSVTFARERPGAFLRLLARKVSYVLSREEVPLNFSFSWYRREIPLLRLLFVGPVLLVPLGLAGLFALPREFRALFVLVASGLALSVAAFFVATRYLVPLYVVLAIPAGAAVDAFLAAFAARNARPVLAPLVALVAGVVLVFLPHGLDDGSRNEETAWVVRLVDTGRTAEALKRLRPLLDGHPAPSLVAFRVGQALRDAGDSVAALGLFEEALAKDPGRPEVLVRIAETAAAAGRGDRAVAALEELSANLARSERPGDVAAAGGRLALGLGVSGPAIELLSVAREKASDDGGLAEALGLAFLSAGRTREAGVALEDAVRLSPDRASAHLNLAAVRAEEGNLDAALRHAREALRLEPGYEKALRLLAALEGR